MFNLGKVLYAPKLGHTPFNCDLSKNLIHNGWIFKNLCELVIVEEKCLMNKLAFSQILKRNLDSPPHYEPTNQNSFKKSIPSFPWLYLSMTTQPQFEIKVVYKLAVIYIGLFVKELVIVTQAKSQKASLQTEKSMWEDDYSRDNYKPLCAVV